VWEILRGETKEDSVELDSSPTVKRHA